MRRKGPQGIDAEVADVRAPWVDSPYYDDAEQWTWLFWTRGRVFRDLFDRLDLTATAELACGRGRHAAQAAPLCGRLDCFDVVEANVAATRARLADFPNVAVHLGSGTSFAPLADASLTAIYCYDAMVHFTPEIVRRYLADAARVLAPGGMALLHHSNYGVADFVHWGRNPHARNHMTEAMFAGFAAEAGLAVLERHVIRWGGVDALDAVSLVGRA